jgi:phosphoribosyl-AMP cyclohydrolase
MKIDPAKSSVKNLSWTLAPDKISAIVAVAKFDEKGLLTTVALDQVKGDILMIAHMNIQALLQTLRTGVMCYWSRSRGKLWVKGETSGNIQKVNAVSVDCDGDAWIFRVTQEGDGAACHEGFRTCFFREVVDGKWEVQGAPVNTPDKK